MDNLKEIFAKKLQNLRTRAGLTQSELGDKLSYSDKTVSKWERGEAIPDAAVLKKISSLFHVSVDSLLEEETPVRVKEEPEKAGFHLSVYPSITRVILAGIWLAAVLAFVLVWIILDTPYWMIFAYAVPASFLTLLVFNSTWNSGKGNLWIVSALMVSVITVLFLALLPIQVAWQLFLLIFPAELVICLSFRIKKRQK